jgi:copper chaperone
MKIQELKIEGMSCGHCVMAVKKELEKIKDINVENVSIGSAKIQYDDSKVSKEDIEKAVDEAGFKLTEIKG